MNRQQLLKRLDTAWLAFKASYADLPEADLLEPGVVDGWSIKDILAHVNTWEQESLQHLPTILDGKRPPRYSVTHGGIDGFNAQAAEQKAALSLAEVLRQLEDSHRRLIELIERVPEDQLIRETPFRRRLRVDSYTHYPEHTEAIRQWRDQRRSFARPDR